MTSTVHFRFRHNTHIKSTKQYNFDGQYLSIETLRTHILQKYFAKDNASKKKKPVLRMIDAQTNSECGNWILKNSCIVVSRLPNKYPFERLHTVATNVANSALASALC